MESKKEKKGGSKIKVMVIAVVAILVVGAGGYVGYTMFLKDKGTAAKTTVHATQQVQQQTGAGAQQVVQNVTFTQPVVSEKTFDLGEFLINLSDEDGKRYLKVKMFLGYDEKKLAAELEEKKPILRDAVISVVRTKKAADITPKGVETIKMEIIQRINPLLEKGQLNNVYINDILVQ